MASAAVHHSSAASGSASGAPGGARDVLVAADVGGTHARLGLVARDAAGRVEILRYATYPCAAHPSLTAILQHFIAALEEQPVGASIACAGFAIGGRVINANLPWIVDARAMQETLALPISLLNDFEAVAYATQFVAPHDATTVVEATAEPLSAPTCVVGPGTGLGAAVIIPSAGGTVVLATESGQSGFAPSTELEIEILRVLRKRATHVAAEHVVSGPGLNNVYQALCEIRGAAPKFGQPADIASAGTAGSDAVAHEALSVFCGALGALAGNLVLLHGAQGGVQLAGGILPKIKAFLLASNFTERFRDKGSMRPVLERVPVRLIEHGRLGVLGAAHWHYDRNP